MLKNRISAYRNERQNRKTENRNAPLRYGRFTTTSISKYEHFTHKINKTYSHSVSVVVSGDFRRFKLALPLLLFLSKDEVKATHFDFDRCPCGGGLRPENPPDRHFS